MQQSKYLVANERDNLWGLTVSTVGYEEIEPQQPYPTLGHADGYYFDVNRGRVLNEYQLLYLVHGEGIFQSTHQHPVSIKQGDMFLLFPDEWHSYRPSAHTGWKSYWIGFKGRNMDDRVKAGFLSTQKTIYRVGYSPAVINLYNDALQIAQHEVAYAQQTLAGLVNHLVGLMYSLERNLELSKQGNKVEIVNRARNRIRQSLETNLTIQELAEELGMGYSNFRKLFKEVTGMAPAMYQQDLKLQRAKELLSATDLSIKEIAYRLNFESPDYFSSKFKTKTGTKPSAFRQQMR